MKSAKQLVLMLLIIGVAGFFTLMLKKGYSIENNRQSNLNWYAILNSTGLQTPKR